MTKQNIRARLSTSPVDDSPALGPYESPKVAALRVQVQALEERLMQMEPADAGDEVRPLGLFGSAWTLLKRVAAFHQAWANMTKKGVPPDLSVFPQRLGDGITPSELRIGQLSTPEIEKLIGLLKTHGALGILDDATFEEQVEAFSKKADRQLLVALHEATRGQPFQETVFDEYESVVPERAKRLYLDICTLHQFGAPVRAGTIARATGVRFDYFKDELLAPLENVVLVEQDNYSGDMAYRSRHAKVAEMVFQQACPDDGAKVERLTRLVGQLDVGYSVERHTMEQVARGRSLGAMIQTAALGREVYQAILKAEPDQAYIYQQWAIYEMQVSDGSYDEAERVCAIAVGLSPRNKFIAHTYSEIARRRARDENSPLRRDRYRQQARSRLVDAGSANDKMVMSSRCKILVDEITDLAKAMQGEDDSAELAEKVKDAQAAIRNFHRVHGEDPDVLQTEALLNEAIDRKDQAITALERAWNANLKGSAVAPRLARTYSGRGDQERANASCGMRSLGIRMTRSFISRWPACRSTTARRSARPSTISREATTGAMPTMMHGTCTRSCCS